MKRHAVVCRLGVLDKTAVKGLSAQITVTEISFIDSNTRLKFGLGQTLEQLAKLGLTPSEKALDLAILAATITAADTRISRSKDTQDKWTREISLHVPVSDPALFNKQSVLIVTILNFLTGDRWSVTFRQRISGMESLILPSQRLRVTDATSVCLFSGGLDSFIGAIDLFAAGQKPLLVSHYWDGITSKHQTYCSGVIARHFKKNELDHVRSRVGFPKSTIPESVPEDTLRGRSFMFFALAALAADALGGPVTIHVPENGFISLNVPLDALRLGSLSTRTTHPFYMARFNQLLEGLGLEGRLENSYRHQTKGQMVKKCPEKKLLQKEARNTMSCSSPAKGRFSKNEDLRKPQHCGHCVPCLIRRGALQFGHGKDETTYSIPDLTSGVINTNKAEGDHVRSFKLSLLRLKTKPQLAKFDIHRPGPLYDHLDDLAAYEKVYVDGLTEVGQILKKVRAEPL